MSCIGDADLVRVRSFDELKVGMTVVVKNCIEAYGKTVSMVLASYYPRNCTITGSRTFACVPDPGPQDGWCFCGALIEGNLYRLRDLDDAEEAKRAADCDADDSRRTDVRHAVHAVHAVHGVDAIIGVLKKLKSFGGPADGE